jgi:mannose-1-phosphate guanylyltransferase
MNSIIPVLLVGGFGDRLWPLSRKSYPKQFSKLFGDNSLFQQSALRLTSSEKIKFKPHITVTNKEFRFIVGEQLTSVGINYGQILIEPESKILLQQLFLHVLVPLKMIMILFYLLLLAIILSLILWNFIK